MRPMNLHFLTPNGKRKNDCCAVFYSRIFHLLLHPSTEPMPLFLLLPCFFVLSSVHFSSPLFLMSVFIVLCFVSIKRKENCLQECAVEKDNTALVVQPTHKEAFLLSQQGRCTPVRVSIREHKRSNGQRVPFRQERVYVVVLWHTLYFLHDFSQSLGFWEKQARCLGALWSTVGSTSVTQITHSLG